MTSDSYAVNVVYGVQKVMGFVYNHNVALEVDVAGFTGVLVQ